jgi:hypothetical protein
VAEVNQVEKSWCAGASLAEGQFLNEFRDPELFAEFGIWSREFWPLGVQMFDQSLRKFINETSYWAGKLGC